MGCSKSRVVVLKEEKGMAEVGGGMEATLTATEGSEEGCWDGGCMCRDWLCRLWLQD